MGVALPVVVTGALAWGLARFALPAEPARWAGWTLSRMLLAAAIAAVLLEYFRLRARAYAPSFSEARLQALQARIRPHFLFNSLNTVLGLIRTDPRRAEHTLENLADLFRVFMRDARELVPMDDEVLTCKEYLAIEQLRLTNRLKVVWDIDEMPGDALIPSLLLQPLLENAVHHGIEPRTVQGTLNIRITHPGDRVRVDIDNPVSPTPPTRSGNQMALSNVKERLMLLYDMEADLKTFVHEERFHLQLEFPYRKERRRRDVRRHHIHPDR
jgi:two-component system sensor histidine kinase AlgZ